LPRAVRDKFDLAAEALAGLFRFCNSNPDRQIMPDVLCGHRRYFVTIPETIGRVSKYVNCFSESTYAIQQREYFNEEGSFRGAISRAVVESIVNETLGRRY
jgi:hypothetical protein